MQIYGPSHLHGPHGLNGPQAHRAQGSAGNPEAKPVSGPSDELQISAAAEAAIQSAESTSAESMRTDLVRRVRSEIAQGTYETPEKLDAALDRLLDEIG